MKGHIAGRVSGTVSVASLDFRAPGVPQRFDVLDRICRHTPVHPPPMRVHDSKEFARALAAQIPFDRTRVVVATNCAAVNLVADLEEALADGGRVLESVAAVEPVTLSPQSMQQIVDEILGQFPAPLRASGRDVRVPGVQAARDDFTSFLADLLDPIEQGISGVFRLPDVSAIRETPLAAELRERYATWLQYVIACYAGAGRSPRTSVAEVPSASLPKWFAGQDETEMQT